MNNLYNVPFTKFMLPHSGSLLLNREGLIGKVNQAAEKKLCVVTAPAGYGKSTTVSKWASKHNHNKNITWIALDRQDSEESSFWHNIIYGISQTENIMVYDKVQNLSSEQSINLIINYYSQRLSDCYIIFDDFHSIDYLQIKKSFEYFLTYMPENLHCIIISRSYPEVSVSKMMLDGQVTIIGINDLHFSNEEVEIFLNEIMQLNITENNIRTLALKTEGWAAALKLAAFSLSNSSGKSENIRNFSNSNKKMFNYILEEVVNSQNSEVREFLIRTSFLKNLNGALCTAVTGNEKSQEILEMLELNSFFITCLDNVKENFRYHSLLSENLIKLLHKQYPDEVNELYFAASRWYQERGVYWEALEYSILSEKPEITLKLLEEYFGQEKSHIIGAKSLCEYFETIPCEMYVRNPKLGINYALALTETGQVSMDKREFTERGIDLNSTIYQSYEGKINQLRVYIALKYENIGEVIRYSVQALEQLPGNDGSSAAICLILGYIYRSVGDIRKAELYFRKALLISENAGSTKEKASESFILSNFYLSSISFLKGESDHFIDDLNRMLKENITHKNCMYFCLASALYDFGDLLQANEYVLKGLELCNTYEDIFYEKVKGLVLLARIMIHTNRTDEAIGVINDIDHFFKSDTENMFILLELPKIVNLLVLTGLTDRAEKYIQQFEANNCKEVEFNIIEAQAELLFAKGKYDEAIGILELIISSMELDCYPKKRIDLLIFAAAAHMAAGRTGEALTHLEKVLAIKDAGKYIRAFLDRGSIVITLLNLFESYAKKRNEANLTGIAIKLINTMNSSMQGIKHRKIESQLSEREMEVLRLLGKGYSYHEIGSKLFISLSTVKKHTGNIYHKLEAGNRMQAVNTAKEKKLID